MRAHLPYPRPSLRRRLERWPALTRGALTGSGYPPRADTCAFTNLDRLRHSVGRHRWRQPPPVRSYRRPRYASAAARSATAARRGSFRVVDRSRSSAQGPGPKAANIKKIQAYRAEGSPLFSIGSRPVGWWTVK